MKEGRDRGRKEKGKCGCCLRVSVAVMKYHGQQQLWEEKVYFKVMNFEIVLSRVQEPRSPVMSYLLFWKCSLFIENGERVACVSPGRTLQP